MFDFRMKILMRVINRGTISTFLMSSGSFWVSFMSMSNSSFNLKTICTLEKCHLSMNKQWKVYGPLRSNLAKLPRFYQDWLEKPVVNLNIDLDRRFLLQCPFTVCFGTPKSQVCVWVTTKNSSSLWCWKNHNQICVHLVRKKKEKKKDVF